MSAVLLGSVRLLNQPPVKEGVKNVIGCITFFGGIAALYQRSQLPAEKDSNNWADAARKTLNFFLTASVVLSILVSRPGLYFSEPFFNQSIFGPNTIFAINPWHPRHILNITANVLSATALIQWVFNRYVPTHEALGLIIAIGAFNFLTGRSTLHLANEAWHTFFKLTRV